MKVAYRLLAIEVAGEVFVKQIDFGDSTAVAEAEEQRRRAAAHNTKTEGQDSNGMNQTPLRVDDIMDTNSGGDQLDAEDDDCAMDLDEIDNDDVLHHTKSKKKENYKKSSDTKWI